jgi:hypothetical protein
MVHSPAYQEYLLVSNAIPRDSIVFKITAKGQVDELILFITERNANLHDRDPRDWSLLHVSRLPPYEDPDITYI